MIRATQELQILPRLAAPELARVSIPRGAVLLVHPVERACELRAEENALAPCYYIAAGTFFTLRPSTGQDVFLTQV